jgi:hypothetical protein
MHISVLSSSSPPSSIQPVLDHSLPQKILPDLSIPSLGFHFFGFHNNNFTEKALLPTPILEDQVCIYVPSDRVAQLDL